MKWYDELLVAGVALLVILEVACRLLLDLSFVGMF
jgi:hypothetical protein